MFILSLKSDVTVNAIFIKALVLELFPITMSLLPVAVFLTASVPAISPKN